MYYSRKVFNDSSNGMLEWNIGIAQNIDLFHWMKIGEIIERNNKLYMFYAGNYNNAPQQIGVAVSSDGKVWKRLSNQPFLPNGAPGSWNSSKSSHPCIFEDADSRTYLFYQGNNDNGKSWYISNIEVRWTRKGPYIIK